MERSLSAARAKAQSRNDRYIKNTIALIGETGRTDFTVQQVVERSRTSLHAFCQHFTNKDELLLAVLEEIMAHSTQMWRADLCREILGRAIEANVFRLDIGANGIPQWPR